MKNSKKIIIAVLLVACFAGGLMFFGKKKTEVSTVKYRTAKIIRGDLRSVIQATGTLNAEETVDVGTQISGTIEDIYVDYNDKVTEGELIAIMDSRTQQAEVDVARASLEAAEASLNKAKATLIRAQRDLKRTQELVSKDLVAKSDLDADTATEAEARADVESAKATVEQCKATLRKAEVNLGYTKIYSPVDGVIISKSVEKGQTVAASYQTPSIVEIARNLKSMQVEASVDEADIAAVREGQSAEFTVDAYSTSSFVGTVTQVRLEPTTTDNVVSYTVIVKVANDDERLMPGMTANVTLVAADKRGVLLAPNSALRFRPVDSSAVNVGPPGMKLTVVEAETPGVYVLQKKVPVKIEVEKGITDGSMTEIISGVEEGTEVLVGFQLEADK